MDETGASAWQPTSRNREVSQALKAYAMMASSASDGDVRVLPEEDTDA